jgi:WD40 repeat protein
MGPSCQVAKHVSPFSATAVCECVHMLLIDCTGSRDTTLKIWNPATCECLQTLTGHKYQVATELL